jgi:hypothetical protein
MIKKVKIKEISITDTDQVGNPRKNKKGKPYSMVFLKTESDGDHSMYADHTFNAKDLETIKTWKEGQEVEVELTKNGEYNNFKLPNKTSKLESRIEVLEKAVGALKKAILDLKK